MDDTRILDCGHAPSPHDEYTTGTAHTPDGREICWACALEQERAELLTIDRIVAYLSTDGRTITTWPGGLLMSNVRIVNRQSRYTPSGGGYEQVWLRATDVHGQRWYGTSPGPGMYVRLHKGKG
jgi:hypothetical protein